MASKPKNGKPKITQICSSNVIHVWLWYQLMKTLNDIGSHVDIKAWSKMAINEMLTLINAMESRFRAPLVSKNMLSPWWYENLGSMSSSLSTPKIQSICALKSACPFQPPRKKSLPLHLCIYISHITHYLDHLT